MALYKVNADYQTTIPPEIRRFLDLKNGDEVAFEIIKGKVIFRKVAPVNLEYHVWQERMLTEWFTVGDQLAYDDL